MDSGCVDSVMGTAGTDFVGGGAAAATVEKWDRADAGNAAKRRGEKAEEAKCEACETVRGRIEEERIEAMRLEAEAEKNKRDMRRI